MINILFYKFNFLEEKFEGKTMNVGKFLVVFQVQDNKVLNWNRGRKNGREGLLEEVLFEQSLYDLVIDFMDEIEKLINLILRL